MATAEKLDPTTQVSEELNADSKRADIQALDEQFLRILNDLSSDIISNAGSSTEHILEISSKSYAGKASEALKDFKDMYFHSALMTDMTENVNKEVDDLFDSIRAQVEQGEEVTLDNTMEENEEAKKNRLAISGVQKKLEMIISIDQDIKERLMPVLSNMQFEDMSRQRLEHLYSAWFYIVESLGRDFDDYGDVAEIVSTYMTSVNEKEDFLKLVLGRELTEEERAAAQPDEGLFF